MAQVLDMANENPFVAVRKMHHPAAGNVIMPPVLVGLGSRKVAPPGSFVIPTTL
jgi:hypothetical protein